MALAFALAGCGDGGSGQAGGNGWQGGQSDQPRKIVPFEIEMAENTREIQAVGTARARAAATVSAETSGIVEEVLFESGQFVEKGQPLLRLEADEERLAVKLSEVSVKTAEQLLARYRRIEDTGAVSASAIDDAITQLEAARINLEQAELALARRTVEAPFEGFIGLTDIDPGARIAQSAAIAALDDRRVLYIDFTVPEDVFGQLAVGETVTAAPFSEGAGPRQAEIVLLDSRIDPMSRAFRVRAAIDNTDDSLRPGMSFEVRFDVPGGRYPLVPEAAIVWGSDGSYLWAVRGGKAAEVPVRIVSRRDGRVLVEGPLESGDLIVAEGVQKVREGTPLELPEGRSGPLAGSVSSSGVSGE
jgi:RND family efflux transporter MFP subunit